MEVTVQLSQTILTECIRSSHTYFLQAKLSLPLFSNQRTCWSVLQIFSNQGGWVFFNWVVLVKVECVCTYMQDCCSESLTRFMLLAKVIEYATEIRDGVLNLCESKTYQVPNLFPKSCPDRCSSKHGATCNLSSCVRFCFQDMFPWMQTSGCCWYFGVLEHHREFTDTCKAFEDLSGLSPVEKPKGIGSPCELVGHHTGSSILDRGFTSWPGLDVTWDLAGNWRHTPESWKILSIKSWGKW